MGEAAISIGMKAFIYLTMVQIMGGFWFLLSLPRNVTLLFMGNDPLASSLFFFGLLLSLAVVMTGVKGKLYLSVGLAVSLVYVMSFMRAIVRTGYLQPIFSPASLAVVPQYPPMLVFFFTLIVGCGLIGWMVGKAVNSGSGRELDG